MIRTHLLGVIFIAASFFSNHAIGSQACGLRVVAQNGIELCLDQSTVVAYRIERNPAGFSSATEANPVFLVHFTLSEAAARKFGDLTEANIGNPLRYFLNDHLVSAPVQQTSILGGRAAVFTKSKAEADKIVAEMKR